MLLKRKLGRGRVRVTFTMPPIDGIERLFLAGEFNGWSQTETPLTRAEDGSWTVSLTLAEGRTYAFRYFGGDRGWHNDWDADGYMPNAFGVEDSLVRLEPPVQAITAKPVRQ